MRALIHGHPLRTWDQWLPRAVAVLRRRRNAASGESPSKIVLGYEPPLPGQWKIPEASRIQHLANRPSVRTVVQRHRTYQSRYAEPQVPPPVVFQPGDRVIVKTKGRPKHPFSSTWLGPYRVLKAVNDLLYEIEINDVPCLRHVDSLRLAPADGEPPETTDSSESEEDSSPGSGSDGDTSDPSDREPHPPPVTQKTTALIHSTERAAIRRMLSAPHARERGSLSESADPKHANALASLKSNQTTSNLREKRPGDGPSAPVDFLPVETNSHNLISIVTPDPLDCGSKVTIDQDSPRLWANLRRPTRQPTPKQAAVGDSKTITMVPTFHKVPRPIEPGLVPPGLMVKPRTIRPNRRRRRARIIHLDQPDAPVSTEYRPSSPRTATPQ